MSAKVSSPHSGATPLAGLKQKLLRLLTMRNIAAALIHDKHAELPIMDAGETCFFNPDEIV